VDTKHLNGLCGQKVEFLNVKNLVVHKAKASFLNGLIRMFMKNSYSLVLKSKRARHVKDGDFNIHC
jgi:hypothetical protein